MPMRNRTREGQRVKPYINRSRASAGRFLTGKTRGEERQDMLGIVPGERMGSFKRYRDDALHRLDSYCDNTQYDKLMPWDSGDRDTYIPIRARKPRVIYNLGKRVVDTVAAKLLGDSVFPRFGVEEDPDTEFVLQLLITASNMKLMALYAVKRMLTAGSSFLRFYVSGAKIKMEVYCAKYCYPVFDDDGELQEIEIRYVYDDQDDLDERGRPIKKWYRAYLSTDVDVLFDNPRFEPGGAEPQFEEVARAEHGLGYVQGQWFKSSDEETDSPDGDSLIEYVTDIIDAINYSLSQGDQAVAYAQEPQLAIKGMDIDEIDDLIKSSEKAWNLGRQGEATFVEADLGGVEKGMELRDKKKQSLSDVCRVVMLDPEKIVGSAQSAKAMEVLHGPLVELVQELRLMVGPALVELVTKMLTTILVLEQQGLNEVLVMPPGWQPQGSSINVQWPEIFPMTMEDLQKKCAVGIQVANASIISRDSILRWLAKDFGIENVEEEATKVAGQPQLNPFGAF
jgi:hypothetical protein